MALPTQRANEQLMEHAVEQSQEATRLAGPSAGKNYGGLIATVISAFALIFSSFSFYETVLRAPDFAIFVPPRIDYTDPDRPDSPYEVFILPLTLANDGARQGTVLSIDLDVKNPRTGKVKKFYAAHIGSWGETPVKPFTPVSLSGKTSYSHAVQFVPRMDATIPRILDFEAGDYQLTLTINTATRSGFMSFLSPKVKPLSFTRQISKLNYFNFQKAGTMPMWSKNYRPAKTGGE